MKTITSHPTRGSGLFRSFWMAGFECSCHINSHGERLDMIAAIQHDRFALEDYRRIREQGMSAARDGVRWHLIERNHGYDWSSWIPMLDAARDAGAQVIWDLCHYGWPDGLDIFSTEFLDRFARFAGAAARIHREHTGGVAFYVPVNEISFFAWGAARPLIFPHAEGRDNELKRQLVRASLAAMDAIWAVDPKARMVTAEPLIHNVPPLAQPWLTQPALQQRNSQFEAWDMLSGRASPELGGAEKYLDVVGVNFYSSNEWEVPGGTKLHWDNGSNDPRWVPLHRLLAEVDRRYCRPLLMAETSHYGTGRAAWLNEISREVRIALDRGVSLEGVCLYPILDRFDWEDRAHWHNCGLWDFEKNDAGTYRRVLNRDYGAALEAAQTLVP